MYYKMDLLWLTSHLSAQLPLSECQFLAAVAVHPPPPTNCAYVTALLF